MAAGPGMHSPPERALQDSDAILGRQTVQPCARNAFWYVNGLPFFGIAQVRSLATPYADCPQRMWDLDNPHEFTARIIDPGNAGEPRRPTNQTQPPELLLLSAPPRAAASCH